MSTGLNRVSSDSTGGSGESRNSCISTSRRSPTYALLATAGNNGVQLPIKEVKDGKLVGTEMLYMDGKFSTSDGKAIFKPSPWPGLPKTVADQKAKHRYWINNGRVNEIWQTAYHDMYNAFATDRWPMAFLEINPDDARALGVSAGDVVEVYNDYGSTHAMAYPEPSIKPTQTFMQFAFQRNRRRRDDAMGRPQRGAVLQRHVGEHPTRRERRRLQEQRLV
jgi:anaerobic selenocysteine-containing dehydrogenase